MSYNILQRNQAIYQRYQDNQEAPYQSRKTSIDANPYRRTLEKSSLFQDGKQQERKERNAGKIIRNRSTYSTQKQNAKPFTQVTSQQLDVYSKYDTKIASKIGYSQVNTPQKYVSNFEKSKVVLGVFNKSEKENIFSRKRGSAISEYAATYQQRVNEYQLKREKIDQQIKNIKKVTIDVNTNHCSPQIQHALSETPKFAASLHASTKAIRPNNKGRGTQHYKWADFLTKIKVQINLFQKLRFLKHQVRQQDKGKILENLKIKYKINKDIITLDSEEFDPFYNRTGMVKLEELTNEIVTSFDAAEKYWRTNLKENFEQQTLNDIFTCFEGHTEKGCISLKGLVCQLGILLQNEKYLRNRDVYLIYKKIQPFTRQTFLRELGKAKNYNSNK